MESVYKLLTLNKNAANSAFNRLLRIKGLKCKITEPAIGFEPYRQHEPGRDGSIFGREDRVDYEPERTYEKTLLVFNVFQEGFAGTNEFDTFTTNTFCLTRYNEQLPIGTQIEINFYGRKMYFKVDDKKNLTPSVTEQLFIKHILVPQT